MKQSRLTSLVEASGNTLIGYFISVAIGQIVYPWFGYDMTLPDNLGLTAIFVAASLTRSYFIRRFFNRRHTHASKI